MKKIYVKYIYTIQYGKITTPTNNNTPAFRMQAKYLIYLKMTPMSVVMPRWMTCIRTGILPH